MNFFPTDRDSNLLFRYELQQLCERDPQVREEERRRFFTDPIYAFNTYFWTYDPRTKPNHLPFITYPFQTEFLLALHDHIEKGEDLLIEKSRDMGISWLLCTYFLWAWLRNEAGNDFLLGSRKEDLVDTKGSLDTLFEKCRYNLYKLPTWLVPAGFTPGKHDTYLLLYNPSTGCSIRGESTNEHFGTGGRYRAILMDEAAKWGETAEKAWISAGDSSPCRIPVSTPYGLGTNFARLRFSKTIRVITYHWSLHPVKSEGAYCVLDRNRKLRSPWYDKECERRAANPISIGQELDIDYVSSGSPAFSTDSIKILRGYVEARTATRYRLVGGNWIKDSKGPFYFFRSPQKRYQYCIGADPAEGIEGGDYSAGVVLNRHTMDVDALYHDRTSPDNFAYDLMTLGYLYAGVDNDSGAWLGIEAQSMGVGTALECEKQGYLNLYCHTHEHTVTKKVTRNLGWKTTRFTKKAILIPAIENYLYDASQYGYYVPPEIVEEAQTFVVTGTRSENVRYGADSGCHDDLLIALGIALVVHQQSPIIQPKQLKVIGNRPIEKDTIPELTIEQRCLQSLLARLSEAEKFEQASYGVV